MRQPVLGGAALASQRNAARSAAGWEKMEEPALDGLALWGESRTLLARVQQSSFSETSIAD